MHVFEGGFVLDQKKTEKRMVHVDHMGSTLLNTIPTGKYETPSSLVSNKRFLPFHRLFINILI